MPGRRLPLFGALCGTLVGMAAVGLLVAGGVLERSEVVTGREAQEALVSAWERSREASYALEGQFEREKPGAGVLESSVFEAQRPPDRIRRSFGGVDGAIDGRAVTCATAAGGSYRCAPNGPATDYAADIATEVERLRAYVSTDPPLYEVASDGDECFLLQQRVAVPDPPYGREARMCFDTDSGALRFLRVETATATDTFRATRIRAVSDTDFALDADPSYSARTVVESTTTTTNRAGGPDEDPVEVLAAASTDEVFQQCHVDGGERVVHAELWDRGISINDDRWWGDAGPSNPCLVRGVLYYLEQVG